MGIVFIELLRHATRLGTLASLSDMEVLFAYSDVAKLIDAHQILFGPYPKNLLSRATVSSPSASGRQLRYSRTCNARTV